MNVITKFSFGVITLVPFRYNSSTESLEGKTHSGDAVNMAKKSAKLPTKIGTLLSYGAYRIFLSESAS